MRRFCRPYGLTRWPILLALLWALGCARPAGLQTNDGADRSDQHQAPFHDGERTGSAQGDTQPILNPSLNPGAGLPFHDSQTLPAGTLLTVRLKDSISSAIPGTEGTFEAVVDETVATEGNQLIPLGTTVSGRVESARSSNVKRNRGYVRLALDSIHLPSGNLPIQTSSLFVRGSAADVHVPQNETQKADVSTPLIHLEKGRLLTFRLTDSVNVAASPRARPDR
jgi:hypothetical protein